MRWGFIPTWAKDLKTVKPQINARAETITAKPFFRSSFLHHRCLIPANGFYEWQKDGKKIPYYYRLNDLPLFAFAGLCDHQTYTIITTQANDLINQVHHRMPVILKPEDESTWLTETTDPTTLLSLLHPYPSKVMSSAQIYPH
jgi:putative SOS response-associated peptidase YedK